MPVSPKIIERLKGNDHSLTSIDLSHSEIDDNDAKDIALALKDNCTVTKINLSNNQISDIGALAIDLSLKENYTLTYFNLSHNSISTPIIEKIENHIRYNCQLRNDKETVGNVFIFDLNKKIASLDNKIQPTEITKEEVEWLYARNNKYSKQAVDSDKVGKWMLFYPYAQINEIWEKVKKGIQEGNLWHAKVSTKGPNETTHAVMIYTKDYTDIKDVIRVLDYLKISELKPPNTVIRYKTDAQTRAGIYSGGTKRPSLYASDTIYKQQPREFYRTRKPSRSDVPCWRTLNKINKMRISNNDASVPSDNVHKQRTSELYTTRNSKRSETLFWRSSSKPHESRIINNLTTDRKTAGKAIPRHKTLIDKEMQGEIINETPNFVAYYLALKN